MREMCHTSIGLMTRHAQEQQSACLSFRFQVPGRPSHGVAELLSSLRNPDPLGEEGGPAARNWARGHP